MFNQVKGYTKKRKTYFMKSIQKIKTNTHASSIPTNKAIQQARDIQSAADKAAQKKHDEQRRQLTHIGSQNSFVSDIDFSKEMAGIKAKTKPIAEMTMSELSRQGLFNTPLKADNERPDGYQGPSDRPEWFDKTKKVLPENIYKNSPTETDPTAEPVKKVYDAKYMIQPASGPRYWIQYNSTTKGVHFMSYQDMTPRFMCRNYTNQSAISKFEVDAMSWGEFEYILQTKPSVAQLYTAGYKFPEIPQYILAKHPFRIDNATPLF